MKCELVLLHVIFRVWDCEPSARQHIAANCSHKFPSCSSIFLAKPPTLRDSVCVCYCFKDNSSISITGPVLSGRGGFFRIWIWPNGASRYVNHRKNKHLSLLRKDILPFWFICHYIWTCLYLHYVHVAFTQDRNRRPQNMSWIKNTSSSLIRL